MSFKLTNTGLHAAAENGEVDTVRELLKDGKYDVNSTNFNGWTPLHCACYNGHVKVVEELIARNANRNSKTCHGNKYTPLHLAASRGNDKLALLLITVFQCDIQVKCYQGRSLLHTACEGGNTNLVRTLILEHQFDTTARDDLNNTPLHVAALNGRDEVVSLLIKEFYCDITTKGYQGRSLLHSACEGGNTNLVRTLIFKEKADINAKDNNSNTPIHLAALSGKKETVMLLIEDLGYDITVKAFQGRSLLHSACKSKNINLVCDLVLKHGADVTAKDDYGQTPLHVAALTGQTHLTHLLINKFNASPLDADSAGNTPLHVCSALNYIECVKVMLAANAPVLNRNNAGKIPRDLADSKVKSLLNDYMSENRGKIYHKYDVLQKHAKKKYSTAERITRIFVIGNPGAGKSTLVENLKREGLLDGIWRVSSVPLHTAGIVPSVHSSKHYGRVLFYDFAGDAEYYSSHAAILENFVTSSKGNNILIIVVDLRKDKNQSLEILNYWLTFVQHQKFDKQNLHVIIAGSHSDEVLKKDTEVMSEVFQKFCINNSLTTKICGYFIMDCGMPKSNEIEKLQKKIVSITSDSPRYKLSTDAGILLGLLEKDFRNVTTCTVQNIVSHIKETHVSLPTNFKSLYKILNELHEIGLLFNLKPKRGNESRSSIVVRNTSKLTEEVHEQLFSDKAQTALKDKLRVYCGIMPESVLQQILPESIPTECLVQLQYCQEINARDVADIPDFLPSSSTSDHTFLFFPALCTADKSDVSWTARDDRHYSIGWLAKCTDPRHFFPPRFLHVLLLRLVFRFTLSAPTHSQATTDSPHHSYFLRRCTMWKTGVHWLMEEGVECLVEMVSINQVVVITKSLDCVMEAKAEFCYSIKPQFFLLNSTESPDYLSESNLFAMSEVEKILSSGKEVVVSSDGKNFLPRQRILFLRQLTHWDSLFPLDFSLVLQLLQDVVKELFELGHRLIRPSTLEGIQMKFPTDIDRARREIVREWLSSSLDPPCWLHLVQALKEEAVGRGDIANMIERKYDSHVGLEKSLLSGEKQSLKPEEEFLEEFAGVVESKWPALASVLSLTSAEIEQLKKKGEELSQKECALQMLRQWAVKEDATYGQLCQRLKTILLFQW